MGMLARHFACVGEAAETNIAIALSAGKSDES
jgi:hypothetical protein